MTDAVEPFTDEEREALTNLAQVELAFVNRLIGAYDEYLVELDSRG